MTSEALQGHGAARQRRAPSRGPYEKGWVLLMRLIYDPDQREQAERIGRAFPRWFVTWGAYSRQFWAFPCFRVPRGTIAHAASPGDLAGMMREIQRSAAGGTR